MFLGFAAVAFRTAPIALSAGIDGGRLRVAAALGPWCDGDNDDNDDDNDDCSKRQEEVGGAEVDLGGRSARSEVRGLEFLVRR